MIELSYFGKVQQGLLKINNRKSFDEYIQQFEGKDVEIIVKRKKAKRSDLQNKFFHSWCTLLSDYTGYSKEEIKEILKYKFLKVEEINDQIGETLTYTKKTSSLNKNEFADFCNEVQQWAYNVFKVKLPLPNENWKLIIE